MTRAHLGSTRYMPVNRMREGNHSKKAFQNRPWSLRRQMSEHAREEGVMDVGASFVADDEASEPVDPGEAALDDPTMGPELLAALNTSPCDAVLDAPATARLATSSSVVGLVGVQLAGPATWSTPFAGDGGHGVDQALEKPLSWTLAPVRRKASGTPQRSVIRWRLVPGLPRSVGLGPIAWFCQLSRQQLDFG